MKSILMMTATMVFIGSLSVADMPQKDDPWYQDAQTILQAKKARKPILRRAKNVILFISDGNGIATNYATRLFMGQQAGGYGEEYILPYEAVRTAAGLRVRRRARRSVR